jgi:CDP-diacylglycerol--serine O-phosphatidyltransferase
MRDSIKGILPGMFTMGNLACGFGAIIISTQAKSLPAELIEHSLNEAVWLVILAAFFDFLDGLVARFSKTYSRFGVELDSLTDLVSFGVAPAVIIVSFSLISRGSWAWILAFVYLMAGSFRLARFNLSAILEQKVKFVGLPIPSAAIAIVSFILFSYELWGDIKLEKLFIIFILATSALMVSTVEFEVMPRFDFTKAKNRVKVGILFLFAIGIMINASLVIFPLVALYILYGVAKLLYSIFIGNAKYGSDGEMQNQKEKKG